MVICKSCALRRFSIQPAQQKKIPNRYLGQPSPFTHPHLLKPGEVTPGLSQVEYALRRHKLMVLIQKEAQSWDGLDHTVILLSNPTYYMSNDIPYIFHQDTNFLYLCGFQEPDSILVLQSIPGKALPSHKSILFVPRRDPNRELWDGPRSGPDGAIALTGVDEAYNIEEFRHLVAKLKGESNMVWYDLRKPVHAELHSDYMQSLAEVKARSKNRIQDVRHLVQNLRLIKSPAEVERMKIAGRVTAEAFTETMFATKSPVDEAFLYAKFEFECRARGADILAYPPVVAGGNRSNTLHYVKNNQLIKNETFPLALSFLEAGTLADLEMICRDKCTKDMTGCFLAGRSLLCCSVIQDPERYVKMVKKVLEEKGKLVQAIHQCIYSSDTLSDFVIQSDFAGSSYSMTRDGELVLLDGGCEFSNYVSDITRTWPVNGRFTKPQAELYQAVLDIQKSCLSLCSPGMSLENIYSLMLSLIGQKLKDLGVLESSITDSHFFKLEKFIR
ncbi:hypothetical protein IHE44_0012229 [Lamprotornis superbus]|uniref:Xaa-Pro aminopeptidase n=1 Tax=Lamprotornis superbus TaxID=245042 RepID=A0A835NPX3_9PASS|nr:hypothetical protein IHE44_0012229 [Lamprotornis superbus]